MSARRAKRQKKARKKPVKPVPEQPRFQRLVETGRDGRLHLAVLRDPATLRERLELTKPVFVEEWQNRLAAAAANTAYAIIRDGETPLAVAQLGKAAMDATTTLVASLLSRPTPGTIACKSGCDHCCHQSVGVTPPEALAIHAHLSTTRSPAELEVVRVRVSAFCEQIRGLSPNERVSPDLPCPFLENHACSIYEVRPLSCRGMNSLDAELCERKLLDPAVRQAAVDGTLPGHVLLEPIRAFHAISAGLQLALAERFGLDMQPLDLALALDLLLGEGLVPGGPSGDDGLSNPPARTTTTSERSLLDRWLAREHAFSAARGGNAGADASRIGLAGAMKQAPPR